MSYDRFASASPALHQRFAHQHWHIYRAESNCDFGRAIIASFMSVSVCKVPWRSHRCTPLGTVWVVAEAGHVIATAGRLCRRAPKQFDACGKAFVVGRVVAGRVVVVGVGGECDGASSVLSFGLGLFHEKPLETSGPLCGCPGGCVGPLSQGRALAHLASSES